MKINIDFIRYEVILLIVTATTAKAKNKNHNKMQTYKIEVSKEQLDGILEAIEAGFTRTVKNKISYGSHKDTADWISDNKDELQQLKEATLLSSVLGKSWHWSRVESETSEEDED